jgi:hypothetical protein
MPAVTGPPGPGLTATSSGVLGEMEAAVMSLGARENYTLHSIEYRLSGSNPELASLLAMFTRLTAGEDMPAREMIQTRWRPTRHSPGNRRQPLRDQVRRLRQHVNWPGSGLVLAALLAFMLLAAAVVLNGGGPGGGAPCREPPAPGSCRVRAMPVARAFAVR